jgi:hypothetical protein
MTGGNGDDRSRRDEDGQRRRVVLLGASNLTRGVSTAIEMAAAIWGRPLEVFATLGHGRSYGGYTTVLGRRLPGILQSGVWNAINAAPPARTAALLTDVGNDLLYGAPVAAIAGWVRECLDRLSPHAARITLALLPLCNIERVTPGRFRWFRNVLFPSCDLSFEEVCERAEDLNSRLMDLAGDYGASAVEHQAHWYGIDPIHFRLRHWPEVWRELLTPWGDSGEIDLPLHPPRFRWIYLRRLRPEVSWLFGHEVRRPQPAGRLRDGTTVALY